MPQPIRRSAVDLDLSPRFVGTSVVAASPTDNAETTIATLTIPSWGDLSVVSGVQLTGWAAFTVGTSGVSANLRIRRATIAGSVIAATGAVTETAANLDELTVIGFDSAPTTGIYVMTLTIASGGAASTVSALHVRGIVV